MGRAGSFHSRDEGLLVIGLLAAEGIEAELLETEAGAFGLDDSRFGPFSVQVSDDNLESARAILERNASQLESWKGTAAPDLEAEADPRRVPRWPWVVVGLAILLLIANQGPDLRTLGQGFQDRLESDRNGDGRTDEELFFDSRGQATRGRVDDNFDGEWDARYVYGQDGHLVSSERDPDFDGDFEETSTYRNGIIATTEIRETPGGPVLRRYDFENGVFARESIDRNGDGQFDEVINFDALGNRIED